MGIIEELQKSLDKPKRMKLKTLIKKFGYVRRTEEAMLRISQLFWDNGVSVSPSILKLGEQWDLSLEDWVYLSRDISPQPFDTPVETTNFQLTWDAEEYLDLEKLASKELRTEKEVETKFIIPLLFNLGYEERDRYDDMPVSAAIGSKPTTLYVDFAVFNDDLESLNNQILLIVEAKRERLLVKQQQIVQARNQAKSYALWTGCTFCLITDGNLVEVFSLPRTHLEKESILFQCRRNELTERFQELYGLISKTALTRFYRQRFIAIDEI
jgi:hypothetical protein